MPPAENKMTDFTSSLLVHQSSHLQAHQGKFIVIILKSIVVHSLTKDYGITLSTKLIFI